MLGYYIFVTTKNLKWALHYRFTRWLLSYFNVKQFSNFVFAIAVIMILFKSFNMELFACPIYKSNFSVPWMFISHSTVFSVNVTKSLRNCRFGHIYWKKFSLVIHFLHFLMQCHLALVIPESTAFYFQTCVNSMEHVRQHHSDCVKKLFLYFTALVFLAWT